MTAECSVAVITANGKLAISNRERGIIKSKATQIIYCRHLDLDHPETLIFNRCVLTGWFAFGCRPQNVVGWFLCCFILRCVVCEQMRSFPQLRGAADELLVVPVAALHTITAMAVA